MRILDVSTAARSLSFCSVLHRIERPTEDRQKPDLVSLGRWVWTAPRQLGQAMYSRSSSTASLARWNYGTISGQFYSAFLAHSEVIWLFLFMNHIHPQIYISRSSFLHHQGFC